MYEPVDGLLRRRWGARSFGAASIAELVSAAGDLKMGVSEAKLREALGRDAARGKTVIDSDHGTQFTSWACTDRTRRSRLVPSMGAVGHCK
jgi:hypothetical protein